MRRRRLPRTISLTKTSFTVEPGGAKLDTASSPDERSDIRDSSRYPAGSEELGGNRPRIRFAHPGYLLLADTKRERTGAATSHATRGLKMIRPASPVLR